MSFNGIRLSHHVTEYILYCRHVDGSLNEFTPDIIVYNAGTDILEGDPLGHLNITPNVSINSNSVLPLQIHSLLENLIFIDELLCGS